MNVIGSRPTGWWRDRPAAVEDFVARLRAYAERTGRQVTVVIDGRALPRLPEGRHGGVEVVYARRGGPDAADDRIVELVAALDDVVEVVTSDRDLQARVRALGARVVRPGALLRALSGE